MINAKHMHTVRELKSYAFGVKGLLYQLTNKALNRSNETQATAVLLSLGGRLGSPMLARVLKDMGFETHVIAANLPGYEIQYCQQWHRHDCLGDYDELVKAVRKIDPTAVFSESRNVLLPVKASLHNDLGLRGLGEKASLTSSSKVAFRKSLDDAQVLNLTWEPMPDGETPTIAYPFVLKPDKGTGSRGVYFVESAEDFSAVQRELESRPTTVTVGNEMIAESYIRGRQFDVEGVSRDGKPYPLSLTEEHYEQVGKYFPSLWYLFSPPIDDDLSRRLFARAKETVCAAGVINGAWHCEMRVSEGGDIYPLDYSNRMGYPKMVSEASGEDFLRLYAESLSSPVFREPVPEQRTVFQRFLKNLGEKYRYMLLAKNHPDHVIEFRKHETEVADTRRFGRVSLRADSFEEMRSLLGEYDLTPSQWERFYE